jgi:hypothetical protein
VGDPTEIVLPSGDPIVGAGYVGVFTDVATPIEGEVFADVASDGRGVIFDGWAGQGALAPARDQIVAMVDGTTVP